MDFNTGRRDEAMTRMERALEVISADEPDEDLALLAARLSSGYWFSGDLERAAERAELALDIAEAHAYPEPLAIALRAKAGVAQGRGHHQESGALLKRALEADDVVLGGGNAKRLKHLPDGARSGNNRSAFVGGFRLWDRRATR